MIQLRYVDISGVSAGEYERLYARASKERQTRADRYLRREDGVRCILADALLRYAARSTLGTEDIVPVRSEQGKPYLPDREDFHFNLSHSGNWVAVAWSNRPVGVDVERLRMDAAKERIARQFFRSDEQAYVFAADGEKRAKRFFRIWTMKESYLKYRGCGLTVSLNSFSVLKPGALDVEFTHIDLPDASMALCAREDELRVRQLDTVLL